MTSVHHPGRGFVREICVRIAANSGEKNYNKARVEVLSKNNVRLAVNSGEIIFFTAKRPHLLALDELKAENFCKICGS